MSTRWDYLYERKPATITEFFLDEAACWLANNLREWPLPIEEWNSPSAKEKFQALLQPGVARPAPPLYRAAFCLARWEIKREWEIIDDYMRNERWRDITTPGIGVDFIMLLCSYLVEQMLSLAEVTQGRITRSQLVDLLKRTEKATVFTSSAVF